MIYDGTGKPAYRGDVAVNGDSIVAVGNIGNANGTAAVDAQGKAMAPEGVFLKSSTHPRAYGNFSRLLGKYVRDEKVIPLEEAVRKLSNLSCENLRIQRRGKLAPGYFADVVIRLVAVIRARRQLKYCAFSTDIQPIVR